MQCKVVRERLCELVDGALAVDEAAEVHEHLAVCEPCRKERDELSESWDLLDAWDGLEPSEDFARSVMRRIATEGAKTVVPLRAASRPAWWHRPTVVSRMVAAFAVAILSAVLFVPRTQQLQPAPPMLDEVIASFDTESPVAVIDDVPAYVVASHGGNKQKAIQRLLAPGAESPTDELLEDLLSDPKDRNG